MSHTASSTAVSVAGTAVPKILVVGGGYAGFYTAWKLEKHLRKGEAEVTIVDPLPYMTYQPFLPEVAAGEIEARHAVVGLRRHLKKTRVITAKVTGIDHANRTATITPEQGESWQESYDQIVVTAGAVSVLPQLVVSHSGSGRTRAQAACRRCQVGPGMPAPA